MKVGTSEPVEEMRRSIHPDVCVRWRDTVGFVCRFPIRRCPVVQFKAIHYPFCTANELIVVNILIRVKPYRCDQTRGEEPT